MDLLSLLRTLGALGLVLGMLWGALWAVRRYDLQLPNRVSTTGGRRIEMVERLSVDGRRSVALIRRDDVEHLILIGPEGHAIVETGIAAPARPERAAPEKPATLRDDLSMLRTGFAALVERYRPVPGGQSSTPALRRKRVAKRGSSARKSRVQKTPRSPGGAPMAESANA
ncbi:flagellar biosynthetic protein FliO [uncultured Sphingomonas sp.]|uniref:FliO/MopB family protein n=1 Tax=uncultured Sphingomonas sp. TaxID=158754 RepID=UPI00260988E7|nr:flagellar biosynthetic protein FliO [uncultured Sphingomonas sp.]